MVTAPLQEIVPAIMDYGMAPFARFLCVMKHVKTVVTAQLRVHARATIIYGMALFVTYQFVIHRV
jgi:hypothetical protein